MELVVVEIEFLLPAKLFLSSELDFRRNYAALLKGFAFERVNSSNQAHLNSKSTQIKNQR